jgi:diaminopimelate epimerase
MSIQLFARGWQHCTRSCGGGMALVVSIALTNCTNVSRVHGPWTPLHDATTQHYRPRISLTKH